MPAERTARRKDPLTILWVHGHRGVIAETARICKVTPQFVGYVLYGTRKSKDGRIERLLREAGAPVKPYGNQ